MTQKKRYEIIRPEDVDKAFMVHTGNSLKVVTVTANKVGKKFGEFAVTKIPAIYKKHGKKH